MVKTQIRLIVVLLSLSFYLLQIYIAPYSRDWANRVGAVAVTVSSLQCDEV